jgi:predicted transcriptional regulator
MNTPKRGSTSEMQVTSIRLEAELKERLREISGEQGYQILIRDVLWRFVEQQTRPDELLRDGNRQLSQTENGSAQPSYPSMFSMSDIRATFRAIAQQEQRCAITGQLIRPQQPMWLGLAMTGNMVPLSFEMTDDGE